MSPCAALLLPNTMPSRHHSDACRLTWKPCAKLTISSSLAAPTREHALEVELPFLQTVLQSFQVVPLVVGDVAPQDVALVLARLWGGLETLIVVSSDLSHYHSYETARRLDFATAAAIERGDWSTLGPEQACGCLAVAGLLVEAQHRGLRAQRLELSNSGDTAGSRDRVVGYGAWVFGQTAP